MANRSEQKNQPPVPMPPIMPPSRRVARRLNEHRGELFKVVDHPKLPSDKLGSLSLSSVSMEQMIPGVDPHTSSITQSGNDPRLDEGYL